MEALEVLFNKFCEKIEDSKEVKDSLKEINKYLDKIENNISYEDVFSFDEAIGSYGLYNLKQGFMAGFEIARQLFTGQNNKSK